MRNICFTCNIYIIHVYLLYPLSFVASHSWCPSSLSLECHSFYPMILLLNSPCAIEGPWLTLNSPNFIHDHDPNFMKMCPFLQQTSMFHFVALWMIFA